MRSDKLPREYQARQLGRAKSNEGEVSSHTHDLMAAQVRYEQEEERTEEAESAVAINSQDYDTSSERWLLETLGPGGAAPAAMDWRWQTAEIERPSQRCYSLLLSMLVSARQTRAIDQQWSGERCELELTVDQFTGGEQVEGQETRGVPHGETLSHSKL